MPARPQHAYPRESLQLAPFSAGNRGRDGITNNRALAGQKAVDVARVFVRGDELHHRLAVFRDDNSLSLRLNFVHHRKAMYLKRTRSHRFHSKPLMSIVIIPWSYLREL